MKSEKETWSRPELITLSKAKLGENVLGTGPSGGGCAQVGDQWYGQFGRTN